MAITTRRTLAVEFAGAPVRPSQTSAEAGVRLGRWQVTTRGTPVQVRSSQPMSRTLMNDAR